MIVRIRLKLGPRIQNRPRKNQKVALALAALLTPSALMSCVLACWRLAADLEMAGEFAISSGVFAHWQAWVAMAVLLEGTAMMLNRYGRDATP